MRPLNFSGENILKIFGKVLLFVGVVIFVGSLYAQKRTVEPADLFRFKRIDNAVLSPDGKKVAYSITNYKYDNEETDVFLISSGGGSPRRLTTSPGYDGNPRWGPEGSMLTFLSDRRGERQIFAIPTDGGEAQQISRLKGGVDSFIWSKGGRYYAIIQIPKICKKNNVKVYNTDPEKQERTGIKLYIMTSSGTEYWNILKGTDVVPVVSNEICNMDFSPDGRRLTFIGYVDTIKTTRTNYEVFIARSNGKKVRRISFSPGIRYNPRFSPDGRYVSYILIPWSKGRAGQGELMIFDRHTGRTTNLTKDFNLNVNEAVWGSTSEKIFFTASDQGRMVVFSVKLKKKKIRGLIHTGYNHNISISPKNDDIFMCRSSFNMPDEIFVSNEKGEKQFELTFANQIFLDSLQMGSVDDFWFKSFDRKNVHGFILKPPFFDAKQKYPLVVLIQNRPHSGWHDRFEYFINPQLFASRGFVVAMINLRGTKGYGKEFSALLNGDWTGSAYRDLMSGLDFLTKRYAFIDESRIVAAGSFYGAFLANTAGLSSGRFSAVVSHACISDIVSFYTTSYKKDFTIEEFGINPFENIRKFDKLSVLHLRPQNRIPVLLTHGNLDLTSNVSQSFEMFSMLQFYNIKSQLVIFKDEGHVLTKPSNVKKWWEKVFDWIE